MQLVYKGSVKDLYKENSKLVFEYSNRYSIFDWGEMPDEIPQKGEALAAMAGLFFEYLASKGIPSHYVKSLTRTSIEVQPVNVLRPEWKGDHYDYSMYRSRPTGCLVPLEVIFRRYLGQGNSLEGRLKKNPAYMQDLGLTAIPTPADSFDPALIEFSTKLETTDRYLTLNEMLQMQVASEMELQNIRACTQHVVKELENLFSSFGVKLWDGKVEYAFAPEKNGMREVLLVDSIGPDELRLTYEGLPLSKEFLRQIYANTPWNEAVKKSKEIAKERKTQDWKTICREELGQSPKKLTPDQVQVSTWLYQALANEIAKATKKPLPFAADVDLKFWHQRAQALLRNDL